MTHPCRVHECAACRPVRNIQAACNAERMQRPWSLQERMQQYAADELRRQRNTAAAAEGRQPELFWRSLYLPEEGMFCEAPKDLQLGTRQKVCALLSVFLPRDLQLGGWDVADGLLAECAAAEIHTKTCSWGPSPRLLQCSYCTATTSVGERQAEGGCCCFRHPTTCSYVTDRRQVLSCNGAASTWSLQADGLYRCVT